MVATGINREGISLWTWLVALSSFDVAARYSSGVLGHMAQ